VHENPAESWTFEGDVSNDGKYLLLSTRKSTDDLNLLQIADLATLSTE